MGTEGLMGRGLRLTQFRRQSSPPCACEQNCTFAQNLKIVRPELDEQVVGVQNNHSPARKSREELRARLPNRLSDEIAGKRPPPSL
jgi:hypothetical protein